MTTLVWLGAALSSLWLAVEFFTTYSNEFIGVSLLTLFFLSIILAVRNAFIDLNFRGGDGE